MVLLTASHADIFNFSLGLCGGAEPHSLVFVANILFRSAFVFLIAIRPLDEDIKPGGLLDANAVTGFRLRPSLPHIHHPYMTPQYIHPSHIYRYTSPCNVAMRSVHKKEGHTLSSIRGMVGSKHLKCAKGWH